MGTRIVVFTDLHANLPALDAVLYDVRQGVGGCDAFFHLGDVIGIGPHPAECLERLLEMPDLCLVMGNHDEWLVDGFPVSPPKWVDQEDEFACQLWRNVQLNAHWTHEQIDGALEPLVAAWPYQIKREYDGVRVTFQHYALARSGTDFEPLVFEPTVGRMDRLFAGQDADIHFYGHHHACSDLSGRKRYVNPGSLGCSADNIARYYVVEFRDGEYALEYRSVTYDDSELFRAFESREVPGRQFFYRLFYGGRFPPQDA
jgi:predicted phosphodiesterase